MGREAIGKGEEVQQRLVNYRKNGERFENLLTLIPIAWDEEDAYGGHGKKRYSVGFQANTRYWK